MNEFVEMNCSLKNFTDPGHLLEQRAMICASVSSFWFLSLRQSINSPTHNPLKPSLSSQMMHLCYHDINDARGKLKPSSVVSEIYTTLKKAVKPSMQRLSHKM